VAFRTGYRLHAGGVALFNDQRLIKSSELSAMPSRAKRDRESLQAHSIYLRKNEVPETSPVEL
jgi:hypothetical protein